MKRIEGTYENDKPVSLWRAWNEDGSLKTEKNYATSPSPVNPAESEPSVEDTDIEIFPNSLPSPSLPTPDAEGSKDRPNQIELLPPPEEDSTDDTDEVESGETLELASPQSNDPSSNKSETIK